MKQLGILTLAAAVACAATAFGQTNTAYTDPSGYVTVNITPAPGPGSTATSAFSVSLRDSKKFSSKATAVSGQTVTIGGQSWVPNTQWADAETPHLLFIENTDGEEAFLITANTADSITVDAPISLESRFPADANVHIVEATTLGKLFGVTSADVKFQEATNSSQADNVYLRSGSTYTQYWFTGTKWTRNGLSNNNNDVVFPDEGVFVVRRSTEPLALVFTGSVPVANQLTSVPSGSTFVGSRYPVNTKIKDMGFLALPGWSSNSTFANADQVYLWTGGSWQRYWHTGSQWTKNGLSNNDEDVIPGNSALFIIKSSSGDGATSGDMPYDLNQPNN